MREKFSERLKDNDSGVSGAFELALHADGVFQSGKWSGLHAEKAAGMGNVGREILISYLFQKADGVRLHPKGANLYKVQRFRFRERICVFGAGGQRGEDGVECDAGYGGAVRLEGMPCGRSREPCGGILVLSQEGGGRGRVQFVLESLVALLEL